MYTLKFLKTDGKPVMFDSINEIRVGNSYSALETVKQENIFNYVFPTQGFFQLIGDNINVTYYVDSNTTGVIVLKD